MLFLGIIFLWLLTPQVQSFYHELIHFSEGKIHINYDHQLRTRSSDFLQTLNTSIFGDIEPEECHHNTNYDYCLAWDDSTFTITKENHCCDNYVFRTRSTEPLAVSFKITNLHLYGGAQHDNVSWPIQINAIEKTAFVTDAHQAILQPIWYTSNGFVVSVDEKVPLFVAVNEHELVLTAHRWSPYLRGEVTHLEYRVCKYHNIKIAYQTTIDEIIGKPTGVPDYRMTEYPVWSTWARYKHDINEQKVREFADFINSHQFPRSQLEIDDKWEVCYGSFVVDGDKFPDMRQLVRDLKSQGFRVTLWLHPFINSDCEPFFTDASQAGYFVKASDGSVVTHWWNGEGGHIDFTNPEAALWWKKRIQELQNEYQFDSFKFDAGESNYLPQFPLFHHMHDAHPENGLKAYAETVVSFGDMVEMRAARGTQRYPLFVRMMDRESAWTGPLSLSTMIPQLLHMNMIGYPFVLPDMVAGNVYKGEAVSAELFIRWLQVSVFMPALQLSFTPSEFDEKTAYITKKFIDLHSTYAPKIRELMIESTKIAAPVNRPLWWIDPTDATTFTIDSEFLLGDDILVAPVIEEGATTRDIYLPWGMWKDEAHTGKSELIRGPVWIKNYPADLDVLPHFTRVSSWYSNLRLHSTKVVLTLLTVVVVLLLWKVFCYQRGKPRRSASSNVDVKTDAWQFASVPFPCGPRPHECYPGGVGVDTSNEFVGEPNLTWTEFAFLIGKQYFDLPITNVKVKKAN